MLTETSIQEFMVLMFWGFFYFFIEPPTDVCLSTATSVRRNAVDELLTQMLILLNSSCDRNPSTQLESITASAFTA